MWKFLNLVPDINYKYLLPAVDFSLLAILNTSALVILLIVAVNMIFAWWPEIIKKYEKFHRWFNGLKISSISRNNFLPNSLLNSFVFPYFLMIRKLQWIVFGKHTFQEGRYAAYKVRLLATSTPQPFTSLGLC